MNYGVINGGGIIGAGEPSIVGSTDAKGWPTRRKVSGAEGVDMALTTFVVVMGARWQLVGGQLLASGVLFVSGYQDLSWRARSSAAFWFFMALAFGVSALATAIGSKLWDGAAICGVALCLEVWLIQRWWSRRTSA